MSSEMTSLEAIENRKSLMDTDILPKHEGNKPKWSFSRLGKDFEAFSDIAKATMNCY